MAPQRHSATRYGTPLTTQHIESISKMVKDIRGVYTSPASALALASEVDSEAPLSYSDEVRRMEAAADRIRSDRSAMERMRDAAPVIGAPQSLGLASLFTGARQAMGHHTHRAPGEDTPVRAFSKEPAVSGSFRLSGAFPAPSGNQVRDLDLQSTARAAGAVQTMSLAVMAESRVLQAGARLIQINAAPAPAQTPTGVVAWYKRPARFEVVTAAALSVVAPGDDVATSPLPLASADIGDWGDAASHAISTTISRRDRKDRTDEETEFIVARALALSLAKACDSALLAAIVATTPTAFTLAKAATRGLRFGELRALCGSAATGAAVGADGILRVNGVAAESTDAVSASIIGAFGRAALAIDDEIRVVVKRASIQGDLEVTAFVSIKPLLPTPDFWLGVAPA